MTYADDFSRRHFQMHFFFVAGEYGGWFVPFRCVRARACVRSCVCLCFGGGGLISSFLLFRMVFFRFIVFSPGVFSSRNNARRKDEKTKWHKTASICEGIVYGYFLITSNTCLWVYGSGKTLNITAQLQRLVIIFKGIKNSFFL